MIDVAAGAASAIRCYRGAGAARSLTPDELAAALECGEEPLWVDIDSGDTEQHALLRTIFRFHPLAIEDTLNPRTRVKIEEYEGYLFIILRAMRFDPDDSVAQRRLKVKKLCLFLGRNYLVSVHAGMLSSISDVAERLRADGGLLRDAGPCRIAHLLCDVIVDSYLPILDEVDGFVETLEQSELPDYNLNKLERILRVRRIAFAAHRSLVPQREIFDTLAHRPHELVSPETRLYFRDVHDHALRITETLDAYRDLIAETTDSNLAQVSMRLGNATKAFSAVATVVIPFVVISAVYGMNFSTVPLARDPNGFWIVIGAQSLISLTVFVFLRVRKLL
jgi:magnesium transporter